MDIDSKQVSILVKYLEENVRASSVAGIEFIDPRGLFSRLTSKQNHVIFGRRGAGKTTFVSKLKQDKNSFTVFINIENFKDITFPNIILHILRALLEDLKKEIKQCYPFYKRFLYRWDAHSLIKEISSKIEDINLTLEEPDSENQKILSKSSKAKGAGFSGQTPVISASVNAGDDSSLSIERSLSKKKIDKLKLELTEYEKFLIKVSKILFNKPIFIVFDDFYFINKEIQPDLLDYFHRLIKNSNSFLKIATIKHRSKLYKKDTGYTGVELGHDIYTIDLDYTFDNFEDLQSFMKNLLNTANETSDANLPVDELFTGEAFSQLCLASGGVPRDFLSLFIDLANDVLIRHDRAIGKTDVNDEAINNIANKLDSLKRDSGDENDVLDAYRAYIKNFVYNEYKTNAFLVSKQDIDKYPNYKQAIRELVDLRLIHLIDRNTSCAPSDGTRYEAYIIDIGMYDNSRPRNFNQIQPGYSDDKSRKDNLRSSPRLSAFKIIKYIEQQGIQQSLSLSE